MKVTLEQRQHMENAMRPIVARVPFSTYEAQGLSPKRYRLDVAYAAKLSTWICDTLYKGGCDDTHVDTALRDIIKRLENEEN